MSFCPTFESDNKPTNEKIDLHKKGSIIIHFISENISHSFTFLTTEVANNNCIYIFRSVSNLNIWEQKTIELNALQRIPIAIESNAVASLWRAKKIDFIFSVFVSRGRGNCGGTRSWSKCVRHLVELDSNIKNDSSACKRKLHLAPKMFAGMWSFAPSLRFSFCK